MTREEILAKVDVGIKRIERYRKTEKELGEKAQIRKIEMDSIANALRQKAKEGKVYISIISNQNECACQFSPEGEIRRATAIQSNKVILWESEIPADKEIQDYPGKWLAYRHPIYLLTRNRAKHYVSITANPYW